MSISFIREGGRRKPEELFVIYADTRNGNVRDADVRWRTIERAARGYAFAEHGRVGGQLRNWPNSEYGWPWSQRNSNNSNTFIHTMAREIGRNANVFPNTPGAIIPRQVIGAGFQPMPLY